MSTLDLFGSDSKNRDLEEEKQAPEPTPDTSVNTIDEESVSAAENEKQKKKSGASFSEKNEEADEQQDKMMRDDHIPSKVKNEIQESSSPEASSAEKKKEQLQQEEYQKKADAELERIKVKLARAEARIRKSRELEMKPEPDSESARSSSAQPVKDGINKTDTTAPEVKKSDEKGSSETKSKLTKDDVKTAEEWEVTPEELPNVDETAKKADEIPLYISRNIREREGLDQDEQEQMPIIDFDPLAPYKGMVRRFFLVLRHVIGLFAGGLVAFRKALPRHRTRGLRFGITRISAAVVKPFVTNELRSLPFPVQLRKRLELMGPTYIKLGQILALREDILPRVVTKELKNLLDRLPEIPFHEIREIIESSLERNLETCFSEVNRKPIGSASIAQTHLARTVEGDQVVLKVVKPGIRDSILTDIRLLKILGKFLQKTISQYQPEVLINEFCDYTEKEVDLRNEADHAELFAANFKDVNDVVFPAIYREYSSEDVLCMEFFNGVKPGEELQEQLTLEEREHLVEKGAESIIKMLYEDGFFHADLHAGNLMVLPGPQLGFIDLGMVGRFEDKTRRRMLYYFHALVNGDVEGATKYLIAMAKVGDGGDPQGFRRAVADLLRRYYQHAQQGDFSMGQLILQSMAIGGQFRVFFPVEMTLMTKALVTFEGVGLMMVPKIDVPTVSQKYVGAIFKRQFNPGSLGKELIRGGPELIDMLVQLPKLTADGLKFLEESINDRSPSNPLEGLRSGLLASACIIGGVIGLVQQSHWAIYTVMFTLALLFTIFGKKD